MPTHFRTSRSCHTGFYTSYLDSFNLIRWHSNGYWKTPLACSASSISGDVRMEVVACKGLSNIQEFYMFRPVRRCIIPCCVRASCAIISFCGRQAKSSGLEGSFEHPVVHYQQDTHTSACSTCCRGSFLLTIRLGIEELVAIPSSGTNTAFFEP